MGSSKDTNYRPAVDPMAFDNASGDDSVAPVVIVLCDLDAIRKSEQGDWVDTLFLYADTHPPSVTSAQVSKMFSGG